MVVQGWSWRRIRDARLRLIELELAAERSGDLARVELARGRLRLHERLFGDIPEPYLEEAVGASARPFVTRPPEPVRSAAPGESAERSLLSDRERFRAMLECWLAPRAWTRSA